MLTHGGRHKTWSIHTTEHHQPQERREILMQAVLWRILET